MGSCSECGEKSMSFTCRYCGKSFCSEHRLPENHDCDSLEESIKQDKEEKWFEDKFSDKKGTKDEDSKIGRPARYKTHRESLIRDLKNTLTSSVTFAVIAVTVFSYILQLTIPGFQELLILDTGISELISRPWSLLTVILLHGPPFHIIGNMITFYFFASPLERIIGGKKLLKIYLVSALASSLGMVIFNNLIGIIPNGVTSAGLVVGASGGVMALVGVIAKLYPDADVLLFFIVPMKIKTAVYGVGVFETLNMLLILTGIDIWIFPIEFFASAGHVTGLLAGLYFGNKLKERYQRNSGVFNPLEI